MRTLAGCVGELLDIQHLPLGSMLSPALLDTGDDSANALQLAKPSMPAAARHPDLIGVLSMALARDVMTRVAEPRRHLDALYGDLGRRGRRSPHGQLALEVDGASR